MKNFILILFLSVTTAWAQTSLEGRFAILNNPPHLHYENPILNTERWPVMMRYEIGFNWFINKSMYLDMAIPFQHTQHSINISYIDPDNNSTDVVIRKNYSYLGFKLGLGLVKETGRTSQISFPVGVEIFTTQFSGSYFYPEENNKVDLMNSRNFKNTLGFNTYFQPKFDFSFHKKKYNPWRYSIFTTFLLINNEFTMEENNLVFSFGGGVGVSYRLMH